jgi:fermentation-respiration switch protein FrsA (DUF1100 family)
MTVARWWWKFLRVPLRLVVLVYVLLLLVAPLIAPGAMYYPRYGSHRLPRGAHEISDEQGNRISTLYLPNPKARYTVWFFHGNAEDLGDLEPILNALHDVGFAVLAFDYPGYGHSSGSPSESSLYAASRRVRRYLREELRVSPERTIIFGRSLGNGPAVQMATEERVGGLIINSGFMSAYRVVTRWRLLPFDQFENLRKLPRVRSPVLVMHGQRDTVIPFYHGEALYAAANDPKRFFAPEQSGHNDFFVNSGNQVWEEITSFAALCEKQTQ